MQKNIIRLLVSAILCLLLGCANKAQPSTNETVLILDKIRWGMTVAEIEQATGIKVKKMPNSYFPKAG